MRQRIELLMPIPADADAGDRVRVYWDRFSGTGVDYDAAPLNPMPITLFDGQIRSRGWGVHPWGVGLIDGRAARKGRFGRQRWGVDPWCRPPPMLTVSVLAPRGFGPARFGVRIAGPTGTVVGGDLEVPVFVSSESPTPVASVRLVSHSGATGQATFTWKMERE